MAITVTTQNFSQILFHNEKPVLLNFFNHENEISRKQDSFLQIFAREHPEIIIGKIDIKKEPSLTAMYGVETVPSIKIFKNGKCTATAVGLQNQPQLARLLTK